MHTLKERIRGVCSARYMYHAHLHHLQSDKDKDFFLFFLSLSLLFCCWVLIVVVVMVVGRWRKRFSVCTCVVCVCSLSLSCIHFIRTDHKGHIHISSAKLNFVKKGTLTYSFKLLQNFIYLRILMLYKTEP